jgi:hypothetical protein
MSKLLVWLSLIFPEVNILFKIISNILKWLSSYISTGIKDLMIFGMMILIKSVITSIAVSDSN